MLSVRATVAQLTLTVSSDVDYLSVLVRQAALREDLRGRLGCAAPACDLEMRVTAGSVLLVAIITLPHLPSLSAVQLSVLSAAAALGTLTTEDASQALSIALAAPPCFERDDSAVVSIAVAPPPPPPSPQLPPPGAQGLSARTMLMLTSIIGGCAVVCVACCVALVACSYWRRRRRLSEPKVMGAHAMPPPQPQPTVTALAPFYDTPWENHTAAAAAGHAERAGTVEPYGVAALRCNPHLGWRGASEVDAAAHTAWDPRSDTPYRTPVRDHKASNPISTPTMSLPTQCNQYRSRPHGQAHGYPTAPMSNRSYYFPGRAHSMASPLPQCAGGVLTPSLRPSSRRDQEEPGSRMRRLAWIEHYVNSGRVQQAMDLGWDGKWEQQLQQRI